jgi:Tol biopolymer transport system component
LQHPHIVPLLSAGRAGATLYYTMPHIEGESLRARIDQRGELPVVEAVRLFREVADALQHAHGEGVIHRDIKPDNVLLSHRHAMVTDFGVARAVSHAVGGGTITKTGMAVGTPAYMSPEQASGDSNVDHRADLYALGLVAYEMLAGHTPFRAATAQALVAAHMTQEPPPLVQARPSVPAALAAIVHRCLEKRPADRFDSATELLDALDRITPSLIAAVETPRALVAPSPSSGISRRTFVLGGAALGLLGVALGVGGAAFARRDRVIPSYQRLTFRRGMIRTARFGPDYQTVLYGALWDGDVCRVYQVRPESPESSALNFPSATPLAVSSTGELALGLGTHTRGVMTYGTLAQVPLAGGAPRELQEQVKYADWSPDGRELAIVRLANDNEQLEFPIGTVVAKPKTPGGGFSFVRVAPSGDSVAVFELNDRDWLVGRVVIVDRTGTQSAVSSEYFNVFGLAWKGDEVWFSAADQTPLFRNTIYAMNAAGDVRVIERVPGNTSLHDIAPNGRALIARTDDRSGISVRVPGETAERDLSWLDSSTIVDMSANGKQILIYEYGVGGGPRGTSYLRNTDGSLAVRLSEGLAQSLSPDGRWAIVATTEAHLDVIPTGAGQSVRLERSGLTFLNARWLPDGQRVIARARAQNGPARLYVCDLFGGSSSTVAVTPESLDVGATGWAVSPAGDSVAVSAQQKVQVFSLSDGSVRALGGVTERSQVVGWINRGVLISEDPIRSGVVDHVDPVTGARAQWAELGLADQTAIMNTHLNSLVTTPDGSGYGYNWHRAMSDLYLVNGWA